MSDWGEVVKPRRRRSIAYRVLFGPSAIMLDHALHLDRHRQRGGRLQVR